MTVPPRQSSFFYAAAIILLAIMLFDVMGAIIKYLGATYPAQQLSVFRNLFGLIPTAIILMSTQSWKSAGRPIIIRQWKMGLLRGGVVALAQLSFYFALSNMEFATATSIAFAGPLFITAMSVPVLGMVVGKWRWLAVAVGFIGVLWVIRPATDSFNVFAIFPLCAAFAYATLSVTSRLFDEDVSTALVNMYSNIGGLVGAIGLVLITGAWVPIARPSDWLWLIAMGSAGGIAVFCLISAYRLADPSSLSPFEYFGIPFSFFLGWFFFAEAPFEKLIPGVFLIVGAGLIIVWREHLRKRDN